MAPEVRLNGPNNEPLGIVPLQEALRMAGDLDVVAELDSKLSNDEFIAKVKANTARWESVASYNKVREDLKNELLLRLAPIVLGLLAGLVGL